MKTVPKVRIYFKNNNNNLYKELKEFYNSIKYYFSDNFSRFIDKCLKNIEYKEIKGENIIVKKVSENRIYEYVEKESKFMFDKYRNSKNFLKKL